jgi:hypothetical protein
MRTPHHKFTLDLSKPDEYFYSMFGLDKISHGSHVPANSYIDCGIDWYLDRMSTYDQSMTGIVRKPFRFQP